MKKTIEVKKHKRIKSEKRFLAKIVDENNNFMGLWIITATSIIHAKRLAEKEIEKRKNKPYNSKEKMFFPDTNYRIFTLREMFKEEK